MDLWGLCPQCERWYYCEQWSDVDAPVPLCPVCGTEACAIEDRTPPLPVRQLEHWTARLALPHFAAARLRHLAAGGAGER